jgi:hypothetical protein
MAMKLLTTNTESNAASSSFTSSIDSTYKLYILKFLDINPATDVGYFKFQGSTDGGSSYGVAMTSTAFRAYQKEDASQAAVSYIGGSDIANSTDYAQIAVSVGNGADESAAGTLWFFNPSNTTFVKHWYSRFSGYDHDDVATDHYMSGFFNTTSAINALDFKMTSGNFDGTIKLYGVG